MSVLWFSRLNAWNVTRTANRTDPGPVTRTDLGPVTRTANRTNPGPVTRPDPGPVTRPANRTDSEPVTRTDLGPLTRTANRTDPGPVTRPANRTDSGPVTRTDLGPVTRTANRTNPGPVTRPDLGPVTRTANRTDPGPVTRPANRTNPGPVTRPDLGPVTRTANRTNPGPVTRPDLGPVTRTANRTDPGPVTRPNSDSEPDPQPSYLLLVPAALRPGLPSSVSVAILGSSSVSVSAEIIYENETLSSNSTTIKGGSTRLLILPAIHQVGSSPGRTYTLKVRGRRGSVQLFSNSTELHAAPQGVSTFIQTNQPRYLPGQVVKIRTVSVRSDGKPCSEPADVLIRDPRGNLLRQWLDKDGVLGVVSTEFQLSENPPLGEWSIMATVEGVSSVKHFSVDYYVLPKFEVLIKVPEVVHREDVLKGFVSAKYFYGKPVRGRMVVTFSRRYHSDDQTHSQEAEMDGSEKFRFDVSTFSPPWSRTTIRDEGPDFLSVQVSVTEHLTGLTCNSTVSVALAKSRFSVTFEDFPKVLRPSLSFSGTLKVSTYNGEPVQDQKLRVSVKQREEQWSRETVDEQILFPKNSSDSSWMNGNELSSEDMELPVPVDGLVPLHIQVQKDTQSLTVEVSLEDCEKTLSVDRSFRSQSGAYLQVQRPSSPAQVGSRLRFRVERNFGIPDVHYLVKSRGQVVSAGRSSGDVSLVPEASWAPLASIVVYCVHPGGEVINDVIHLPITHFLQNKVSLRWSSDLLKPAEAVTLKVSVEEPDSLVGILVVDKATRCAGSNNDITMETVQEQMTESSMDDTLGDGMTMGDPFSVFQSCDLSVMTDASVLRADPTWLLTEDDPGFFLQTDGEHFRKQPEPHQRQNFPETWVWMDVNTGDSDRMQISLSVPDSITTWTASAFVVSENLGLGLTEKPAELTVFQDFFLSLNLPAYIIRGEELVLEVDLFNYLQEELEVTVIVAESDAFEFVFPDSEAVAMASVRRLLVEPEGGATVLVPIRPLVLGDVPIAVKAVSSAAADFVRTTVLVKAEGRPQSFSSSLLLDLPAGGSGSVAFRFPPGVVDGSQRVLVTAIGDLLGPSISGLDSLVQMPYGCGEQNMIHFAPNIYVLRYLSARGSLDPVLQNRAIDYMLKGYEQQLSYQRADGSFSAFGQQDSSGSTWLTAFVLRCLLQAQPWVGVDGRVLESAAAWLAVQQAAGGAAAEPGTVIHSELQGGLDGPVSLTAYVLVALLEDGYIRAQYASRVTSALAYLEARLVQGVSSNYSLSLLSYALALAGSPTSHAALNHLIGRADLRDGVPTWSSPDAGLSSSWQPRSADIEMASYVLLSLHKLNRVDEGLSLMKWLSQQRNHLGGYGSTQDTVVALQALSAFAALRGSEPSDLDVTVTNGDSGVVASFHIDHNNFLLLQSRQIDPQPVLDLQVMASGRGLALFQLNVFYNVRSEELLRRRRDAEEQEAFDLKVALFEEQSHAHLFICTSLARHLGLNETGMVLMEVGLLSGFSARLDLVPLDGAVKRVETEPGRAVLYLDSVSTQESCLLVPLLEEFKVARVQEASVSVYDYYEPRRRTVRSYRSSLRSDVSSCSFCGDDCSRCRANNDYELNGASRCSRHFLPALLLLFLIFSA
ncbi:CD109 antigen isoform X1 [Xiphophorus couchianus]|uniref:CD109 antigen isoform X1 n=1 Tax=Xiphophorus couchianus TaxID=32473 RepID=UPI0010162158|nr:CD109 antigen isoform X1 [Xiphophorus couchianus]